MRTASPVFVPRSKPVAAASQSWRTCPDPRCVGKIEPEPINLRPGVGFTLTYEDIIRNTERVSMSFEALPKVVKPGDRLFLNDGLIQLIVESVAGCRSIIRHEVTGRGSLHARADGGQIPLVEVRGCMPTRISL